MLQASDQDISVHAKRILEDMCNTQYSTSFERSAAAKVLSVGSSGDNSTCADVAKHVLVQLERNPDFFTVSSRSALAFSVLRWIATGGVTFSDLGIASRNLLLKTVIGDYAGLLKLKKKWWMSFSFLRKAVPAIKEEHGELLSVEFIVCSNLRQLLKIAVSQSDAKTDGNAVSKGVHAIFRELSLNMRQWAITKNFGWIAAAALAILSSSVFLSNLGAFFYVLAFTCLFVINQTVRLIRNLHLKFSRPGAKNFGKKILKGYSIPLKHIDAFVSVCPEFSTGISVDLRLQKAAVQSSFHAVLNRSRTFVVLVALYLFANAFSQKTKFDKFPYQTYPKHSPKVEEPKKKPIPFREQLKKKLTPPKKTFAVSSDFVAGFDNRFPIKSVRFQLRTSDSTGKFNFRAPVKI